MNHRNTRGRGLRGPLMPPDLPAVRSRRAQFADAVAVAANHLAEHTPEMRHLELKIAETPARLPDTGTAPLGAVDRTCNPTRLEVYRQPVLLRARRSYVGHEPLIRDLLAELVADVLCRDPIDVDPHYPRL